MENYFTNFILFHSFESKEVPFLAIACAKLYWQETQHCSDLSLFSPNGVTIHSLKHCEPRAFKVVREKLVQASPRKGHA